MPFKLGYDLSGTVVAVGSQVPSHIHPGVAVYSRVPDSCRGTVSEYCLSTASSVAPKPLSLSHTQAASIPLVSLTALQAFDAAEAYLPGGLKGRTVYIPAALSGTGSMAVQLAKNVFGVGKVITTLSPFKLSKAESLLGPGMLDKVIDYTQQDPKTVIPKGSIDFMFDTMGLGLSSFALMKRGGIILSIKTLPFGEDLKRKVPHMPRVLVWILGLVGAFIQFWARRYGVFFRPLAMRESARDLVRLGKWIDEGKIRPVVGRVAKLGNVDNVKQGCNEVYGRKGGTGKFVVEIGEANS